MGIAQPDDRLSGLIKAVEQSGFLVESHQTLVEEVVGAWWQPSKGEFWPIVQLYGSEAASQRSIAAAACRQLDLNLYGLSSNAIPTNHQDLHPLIRCGAGVNVEVGQRCC